MINLKCCIAPGCNGKLRTVQTGAFHKDTRVTKLKCAKCGHLCCSVQFIAPAEVMKYTRAKSGRGDTCSALRLRWPITVDLDPDLRPEIRVNGDISDPWG